MRLGTRAVLLFVMLIVGSLGSFAVGASLGRPNEGGMVGLLWGVVWMFAAVVALRCPHCRQTAIIRPDGEWRGGIGAHCRYCGREF